MEPIDSSDLDSPPSLELPESLSPRPFQYPSSSRYDPSAVEVLETQSEEAKAQCKWCDALFKLEEGSTKKFLLYNDGKDDKRRYFSILPLGNTDQRLAEKKDVSVDLEISVQQDNSRNRHRNPQKEEVFDFLAKSSGFPRDKITMYSAIKRGGSLTLQAENDEDYLGYPQTINKSTDAQNVYKTVTEQLYENEVLSRLWDKGELIQTEEKPRAVARQSRGPSGNAGIPPTPGTANTQIADLTGRVAGLAVGTAPDPVSSSSQPVERPKIRIIDSQTNTDAKKSRLYSSEFNQHSIFGIKKGSRSFVVHVKGKQHKFSLDPVDPGVEQLAAWVDEAKKAKIKLPLKNIDDKVKDHNVEIPGAFMTSVSQAQPTYSGREASVPYSVSTTSYGPVKFSDARYTRGQRGTAPWGTGVENPRPSSGPNPSALAQEDAQGKGVVR